MFSATTTRRWLATLVLPVLAIANFAHADETDRDQLIAAINVVNIKIDAAYKAHDGFTSQIRKSELDMNFNKRMYEETQKDEYIKAYEKLAREMPELIAKQRGIEIHIIELLATLDYLEDKLAQLGD